MIRSTISRNSFPIIAAAAIVIVMAQHAHAGGTQGTTMEQAAVQKGASDCTASRATAVANKKHLLAKALAKVASQPEWAWTLETE